MSVKQGSSDPDYMRLRLDIFDTIEEPVEVLRNITPDKFIEEILRHFRNDQKKVYLQQDVTRYDLVCIDNATVLKSDTPIGLQGLADNAHLCLQEKTAIRIPTNANPAKGTWYLRDTQQAISYRLNFFPCWVGRKHNKRTDNDVLAVDLSEHRMGRQVSRRHVELSEDENGLKVRCDAIDNDVYLVRANQPECRLTQQFTAFLPGDTLLLVHKKIALQLVQQI